MDIAGCLSPFECCASLGLDDIKTKPWHITCGCPVYLSLSLSLRLQPAPRCLLFQCPACSLSLCTPAATPSLCSSCLSLASHPLALSSSLARVLSRSPSVFSSSPRSQCTTCLPSLMPSTSSNSLHGWGRTEPIVPLSAKQSCHALKTSQATMPRAQNSVCCRHCCGLNGDGVEAGLTWLVEKLSTS